jgi:hypothetical protein
MASTVVELEFLLVFGDCREVQYLEASLLLQKSGQIIRIPPVKTAGALGQKAARGT